MAVVRLKRAHKDSSRCQEKKVDASIVWLLPVIPRSLAKDFIAYSSGVFFGIGRVP